LEDDDHHEPPKGSPPVAVEKAVSRTVSTTV
jgi:hypothetical protein